MTADQASLLERGQASLDAARLLHEASHHGFAAARAYYAMFYAAQALLLGLGLSFSKHSGVIAAFGQHLAKPGTVPTYLHRYLIRAMEVRQAGDYGAADGVTSEESAEQIARADEFLLRAEQVLDSEEGR